MVKQLKNLSEKQDKIYTEQFCLSPAEGNGSSGPNFFFKAHFILHSWFSLKSWRNAWTTDSIQESLSTRRILCETQREAEVFK